MLREASTWPASTPSKPISLARVITVERAASSSAQVNTVGFSPLAGSRINAEEMDVNALLLLGLAALRRSMDEGTAAIFAVGLLPFRL